MTLQYLPTSEGCILRTEGLTDSRVCSDLFNVHATWFPERGEWEADLDVLPRVKAVVDFWSILLKHGLRWLPVSRSWHAAEEAKRVIHLAAAYLNALEPPPSVGTKAFTEDAPTEVLADGPQVNPDGPQSLAEYDVGQGRLIRAVETAVKAARMRGEPLDHVLLDGPPGLGKTTLANIIAKELGGRVTQTSGPALEEAEIETLVEMLTNLGEGDVLFVDEVHRLSPSVEEFLYPAMEVFRIDRSRNGDGAGVETIDLSRFTLIGATTRPGLLSAPLRSRFGIRHHLDFYTPEQLAKIIDTYAGKLGLACDAKGLAEIARRSRGTARIAKNLLRRASDWALVNGDGRIDLHASREALSELGIDEGGLDTQDRQYLEVLVNVYRGGPAGVKALASTLNVESDTLEDVVEPYLLKLGFVVRRPRGRQITHLGLTHIGVEKAGELKLG